MLFRFNKLIFDYNTILNRGSKLFSITVIIITSIILIYSMSYIFLKKKTKLFFILILLFSLRILIFILTDNLISLILGWDGLGFSSFLLILYYSNTNRLSSRLITVLINRVGDVLLLLTISVSINSVIVSYRSLLFRVDKIFLIWLIIFVAFTKSAQFPFSAWLPAAIRAPTPTSALVHSSTLVTAGVYLLIQNINSINYSQKYFIIHIALITIILSSVRAVTSNDIKKIIAISTLSQMRLLCLILSYEYLIAINHLLNHAIFKATLFLVAGYYIHVRKDWQDQRIIKINLYKNPLVTTTFILRLFCLMGLPYSARFYSKHIFIDIILNNNLYNKWIVLVLVFSAILTIIYSVKLFLILNKIENRKRSSFYKAENDSFYKLLLYINIILIITGSLLYHFIFPKIYSPIGINTFNKFLLLLLRLSFLLRLKKKNLFFFKNVSKRDTILWQHSLFGGYIGNLLRLIGFFIKKTELIWLNYALLKTPLHTLQLINKKMITYKLSKTNSFILLNLLLIILLIT